MNYSPDEFLQLMEAVEAQGGAHSSEPCKPRNYKLRMPKPGNATVRVWKNFTTTGCGAEARFVVPYDPTQPVSIKHKGQTSTDEPTESELAAMVDRGAGMAAVCAVDDSLGLWPRFANTSQED